jgi:hypothetical protein
MLLQLDDSPSQIGLVSSTRAANDDLGHILLPPQRATLSLGPRNHLFPIVSDSTVLIVINRSWRRHSPLDGPPPLLGCKP